MALVWLKMIAVVAVAVVAGGTALANAWWGPKARARKRLEAAAKTTIVDRELVTLTGTVRASGRTLDAPLSGKPCVLYEVTARIYESVDPRDRNRTLRAELAHAEMVAFDLETDQGIVHVEGERADTELPHAPVIPRRLERERALLEAHGHPTDTLRSAGFEECVLEPGAKVHVQGMAIIEQDPRATDERGFRDDAPRRIRLVAHPQHPLTIGRARK